MATFRFYGVLLLGLTALGLMADAPSAAAGECKRKTAGFYLQFADLVPRKLSVTQQAVPVSLTGLAGDAARGQEVLTNPQKGDCLSCHKVSSLTSAGGQGEIGPSLDGVGKRYSDGQLRLWIVNPTTFAPNTIMPSYHIPGAPAASSVLAASDVEDLVSYMKTLK